MARDSRAWPSLGAQSGRAIREDLRQRVRRLANHARVGVPVVRKRHHRLEERPATPPQPRRLVDAELGAVELATLAGENVPGRLQVARRIADVQSTPVDHRSQPTVDDEKVPGEQVAVYPHLLPMPWRGIEGLLPQLERRFSVKPLIELLDRSSDSLVEFCERCSTRSTTARRSVARIDLA